MTVEGLELLPPIAFVSVRGTVITVVINSVVTDPMRAGQSVIVWAQEVMVYVFVMMTVDTVSEGSVASGAVSVIASV